MATIVDGRKIAFAILNDLETRVNVIKRQGGQAALAVVMVGDHKPSQTYVRKKGESAQKIGVDFFKFVFPEKTDKETLKERLKQIQQEHQLAGMILQLPLPERLWPFTREIVNQIGYHYNQYPYNEKTDTTFFS
ncbi:MAG: Bifunctional protein FolD [Parcubacteria group bacterium GW2011_GWC2_45_15]|nr:MAG: Bifunctional protein FolD [Parcubacteria group bacterium GW2011_GWC2_45_15]